jgi:ribose-phosphate pyrophosphokinase
MDLPLIFSGTANPQLAQAIAQQLGTRVGRALVGMWRDGETRVRIEENVRGADVFVVQPTCPPQDHNLMQLLIMIDALKRASAQRITAVIPYYGYAKQEKKTAGREPITAKLVANLITTAGANRILTMDLHAPAIEGFFDIPVDHLQAGPLLADYIRELNLPNIVVVSPDSGGVGRATRFRDRLPGSRLAIIAKQRPQPEVAEVIEMVGEVHGCTAVIVDDLIQSGGTIVEAAKVLLERGARAVYACATHPVFAESSIDTILHSPIQELVVTDTIPVPEHRRNHKIRVITVAPLLAEAILRIHKDLSLSSLFV